MLNPTYKKYQDNLEINPHSKSVIRKKKEIMVKGKVIGIESTEL